MVIWHLILTVVHSDRFIQRQKPVDIQDCVESVSIPVEEEGWRVARRVPVAVQQHLLQVLSAEGPAESEICQFKVNLIYSFSL